MTQEQSKMVQEHAGMIYEQNSRLHGDDIKNWGQNTYIRGKVYGGFRREE